MAGLNVLMVGRFHDLSFGQKSALIIVSGLLLRFIFFTGVGAADDVFIANAALRVLEEGPYLPDSHYTGRLMLIYPQALIFQAFGVGEWQMAVLPLVGSLTSLLVAWALARRYWGETAALWALGAGAIFPLDVFFSTKLMPDAPIGGLLAASFFFAVKSLEQAQGGWKWGTLAGLLWGAAYLVKIEAAFLLFPLGALFWMEGRNWRAALVTAMSCGLFVVGENLIYWGLTGEILYRLKIIADSAPMLVNPAYSEQQLWVFPKAWFLTFYQFSLHYYLLFIAVAFSLWARNRKALLTVIWAASFLLWLQFGANPMAEELSFKSHLQRYCLMLSAPSFMLIGYLLAEWQCRSRLWARSFGVAWCLGSLFLICFNNLSAEKAAATKQVLAEWSLSKDAPVYMDASSLTIGRFLYYGTAWRDRFLPVSEHDFKTAQTVSVSPAEISGYVVLNRGFVEYSRNRYFVSALAPKELEKHCQPMVSIDNPSYRISYRAAAVLEFVGRQIPLNAVRDKIISTVTDLQRGEDVIVYECGNVTSGTVG